MNASVLDLDQTALPELFDALVRRDPGVRRLLELAFEEDVPAGGADVTSSSIIAPDARDAVALVARESGVAAGLALLPMLLDVAGGAVACTPAGGARDGERIAAGQTLARIEGRRRDLLRVERVLLNFVGRMAGVASLTRRYVDAVAGTRAAICDTRKTLPGWRHLDKYAVRCGGGTLHRIGLFDAVMYKDNHLSGIDRRDLGARVAAAARAARAAGPLRYVAVEVDDLEQLAQVLAIEPGLVDLVLLDNFDGDRLRRAVAARDAAGRSVPLEASGGITLETVRHVAETGVDRISVGALTHSAPALDVAFDAVSAPSERREVGA